MIADMQFRDLTVISSNIRPSLLAGHPSRSVASIFFSSFMLSTHQCCEEWLLVDYRRLDSCHLPDLDTSGYVSVCSKQIVNLSGLQS